MKEYKKIAQVIIKEHDLSKYIDILLNYWEENPPTLGHGFNHVLKVGVEAYEIGKLNNYPVPESLFIGGLFHDIFRPAETGEGNEDQTKGAQITRNLFESNNVENDITNKVIAAIQSHDEWRGELNAPLYDIYLSYGDKISHDISVTYGYVWSVNKFVKQKTGKPKFKNHLFPLYAFLKYEQRAWEIFVKHPINGSDRAIESYIAINKSVMDAYLNDKTGEKFFEFVENIAGEYRKNEAEYLEAFNRSPKSIKKLMTNCY